MITATVYKDADHEVRTYPGWHEVSEGVWQTTEPVQVSRQDQARGYSESLAFVWTDAGGLPADENGLPDGSEPLAGASAAIVSLSRSYRNLGGQTVASDDYFSLDGVTYSTDADRGVEGQNYLRTGYDYNRRGWLKRTLDPTGTIRFTEYDDLGRAIGQYVGTDDDDGAWRPGDTGGSANMVQVSASQYDGGAAVGDGLLTSTTLYVDANSTNNRVSSYRYDWRDRPESSINPADAQGRVTYAMNWYDNLGRVTKTQTYLYDGSGALSPFTDATTPGDDMLLTQATTSYDALGRAYQTATYAVDITATNPTPTDALVSNAWYDARGYVFKSQAAGSETFAKTAYDGAGRVTAQYVGYDPDGETTAALYDAAGQAQLDLSDDKIFEQAEYDYDAAGNPIFTTSYQRLAGGAGSVLTTSNARATYVASWFDALGRQTGTANYGNNLGTPMDVDDRPTACPSVTVTDALVTQTAYVFVDANDDGQLEYVVQNSMAAADGGARTDWTIYDAAGRTTATIQNFVDGDPTTDTSDEDVTTQTTYTAGGQIATYTVVNPDTGDQVTTYVYGSDLGASGEGFTPLIYDNRLLRAVIYPDSTNTPQNVADGSTSGYDRVEYRYDRQGEQTQVKDQNGTVHDYVFDKLGRETEDKVSALGSYLLDEETVSVDGSVRRIDYAYEVRGLLEKVTSYNTTSPSNPVLDGEITDEVLRDYNEWGLLAKEYQSHAGPVDTDSTLRVQYKFDDPVYPTRLTGLCYPTDGVATPRELTYDYSDSGNCPDWALGRVTRITDTGGGSPTEYSYLGLGQIVGVVGNATVESWELDQFGRVSRVYANAGGDDVDIRYGYDAAGNRTSRTDAEAGTSRNLDERYTYDNMNQLTKTERGHWIGSTFTPSGSEQDWSLDATGNWDSLTTDGGTPVTRDYNEANEISSSGAAYDMAGNMTLMPQPNSPAASYICHYDAWNRLVSVTTGSIGSETAVAEYRYDGLNRRIEKDTYTSGVVTEARHYYLSAQNQVLEERVGSSTTAERQNVWGLRYIDDLILRDRSTANNGTMNERLYAVQDANWNVVAVLDINSNAVERYTYTAYGTAEIRTGDFDPVTGNLSQYSWASLYTCREYDPETGLYYYRARYYDAAMGRFLSTDAIFSDANLYRYCRGNPEASTDPSGYANLWNPLTWGLDNPTQSWWGFVNPISDESVIVIAALPGAYVETASNGQQASSLAGFSDSVTSSVNPFGGGTHFGPAYGWNGDYSNGQTIGRVTGLAVNTVLTVSGARGVVTSVQAIRAAGGLIQVGRLALVGGGTIEVVVINGQALALTPAIAAQLGLTAAAGSNILNATGKPSDNTPPNAYPRNPAQDRLLTRCEIEKLKKAGFDIHELKGGTNASRFDLYKDVQGNIFVKPKGGIGPGDPLHININSY